MINSRQNRRVVQARKLDHRKHRLEQGRFKAEGLQLLHMAVDANVGALEVFFCQEQFSGREVYFLLECFERTGADLISVSSYVMQSLSDREICQGMVATFPLLDVPLSSLSLKQDRLILILDRLQDPGNLGTLIRTADAVAAAAVILLEPCVDPFDPKTVRGSMGSVFNVPLVRTADAVACLSLVHSCGIRSIAADVQRGNLWGQDEWSGGVALVLGNEARGLSNDVQGLVQAWVRLPILGKAESLNVAVAGGTLMYSWLRMNFQEQGGHQESSTGA